MSCCVSLAGGVLENSGDLDPGTVSRSARGCRLPDCLQAEVRWAAGRAANSPMNPCDTGAFPRKLAGRD